MAEMESLRCEAVPHPQPHPVPPRSRVSGQNGAIKLQRLMLEALISKRMSGMVKTHLENAVTKQLDDIVKIRFRDLMFSPEFMQPLMKNIASPDQSSPPVSPPLYQLQFRTEEFDIIYATNKLVGKSGDPIDVALVDESGNVVSDKKESSALLELLVLDANLSEKVTTLEEFRKAEQMPWDPKNPLLKGSTTIKLHKGIGVLDPDLCFTDNSSWASEGSSKGLFCLGLVPVSKELRIQGAKTRAFKVLDQRSKGNQKHEIPESTDDVWRLKLVRKGGIYHQRLMEIKVNTVGDFLKCLDSNPDKLKKIFGREHIFNAVVLHARKCKRGDSEESNLTGTCYPGVSSYRNGKCFIREEDPIAQGEINQPMPSIGDPRSDLVGSSSTLLDPNGTTYLEDTPEATIHSLNQAQDIIPPLVHPEFADSNMPTEYSNMHGRGSSVIHSEFDTVRGQEIQDDERRNQHGHNGFGMLGRSGRNTSSIMRSATYAPGLLGSEDQPAHVVAVTSPSTSLKRRRDQNHDPVCRWMRPRHGTYQSPSNQVESVQDLPCHGLFLIGAQPDSTKYSGLSPHINPYLTIIPMETSNGAISGYPSSNMAHPSTNLFTTQANTGNSQIEFRTERILPIVSEGLMVDLDDLGPHSLPNEYSDELGSNQGYASSTEEPYNDGSNISLWNHSSQDFPQ